VGHPQNGTTTSTRLNPPNALLYSIKPGMTDLPQSGFRPRRVIALLISRDRIWSPHSKSFSRRRQKPGALSMACSGRSWVLKSSTLSKTGQLVEPSTDTSKPPGFRTRMSSLIKVDQSRTCHQTRISMRSQETHSSHQRSAMDDVESLIGTWYTLYHIT